VDSLLLANSLALRLVVARGSSYFAKATGRSGEDTAVDEDSRYYENRMAKDSDAKLPVLPFFQLEL